MSSVPTGLWPWLALAGLGAFHGLNPAMGWLFAVALGLHQQDRRGVWAPVRPIPPRNRPLVAPLPPPLFLGGPPLDSGHVRSGLSARSHRLGGPSPRHWDRS